MNRFRLSRRTMLQGAFGAAVGLPLLEIMEPRSAFAQVARTKRYLVTFAGLSLGGGTGETLALPHFVPTTPGQGFTMPTGLAPLATRGLANDISVITNLKIGWNGEPGSRPIAWHASSLCPLFAGATAPDRNGNVNTSTSDQVVADAIAGNTKFKSLVYRVQPAPYRDGVAAKGRMSYRAGTAIDPVTSPRLAYQTLFANFTPSTGAGGSTADAEAKRVAALKQKSVLDLVKGSSDRLKPRLGAQDQKRLQQHFDEVRDLENRLQVVDPVPTTASCKQLTDPGADPASVLSTDPNNEGADIGYSKEFERARLLSDFIHMAFTCDLTRSVALAYSYAQCFMNVNSFIPNRQTDAHELGHGTGTAQEHGQVIAWVVDHWAYLLQKLKATPEGASNLLDNTASVLLTEGGYGFDPEGGRNEVPHSSERMGVLVAGRAGGALTPRGHIVSANAHPAQVLVSVMNALGVPGGLKDIKTPLPGL
jgi:hypothetical protein